MELRDFFTEAEIHGMKERIVKETSLACFMVDNTVKYPDGEEALYRSVEPTIKTEIHNHCKAEIESFVKQTIKEVIHNVIQEKVTKAAERFTENLCNQLDRITEKTNWYWSIK